MKFIKQALACLSIAFGNYHARGLHAFILFGDYSIRAPHPLRTCFQCCLVILRAPRPLSCVCVHVFVGCWHANVVAVAFSPYL